MTTTRDETYDAVFERLRDEYDPDILAFLRRCRDAMRAAGLPAEDPVSMHDDAYRWTFRVWANDATRLEDDYDRCADVTLELAEARDYDREDGYGFNFGLSIVAYGGEILGGFEPYNFTPEVWVDARDSEAVADRWAMFDQLDLNELPETIAGLDSVNS